MTQYTPEDLAKLEKIKDKMRGGPMKRIEDFARSIHVSPNELMGHAKEFIDTDGEHSWNEGDRFESVSLYDGFWADYELVTGQHAPAKIRSWGFFSCAC